MENTLLEAPKIRLLYRVDAKDPAKHALRNVIDHQVNAEHKGMRDGDYGERAMELYRSPASAIGTSSLIHVRIPKSQPLHIHANPSDMKAIDAESWKLPADKTRESTAHRLLIITTGRKPGIFEWFSPEGAANVARDPNLSTDETVWSAAGKCCGKHLQYEIPPYSCIAVELAGGVHRFGHEMIWSYHPHDLPKSNAVAEQTGPSNTLNWSGDIPAQKITVGRTAPRFRIETPEQLADFQTETMNALEAMVASKALAAPMRCMETYLAACKPDLKRNRYGGKTEFVPIATQATGRQV